MKLSSSQNNSIFLKNIQLNHREKVIPSKPNTLTYEQAIEINRANINLYCSSSVPITYIDYTNYPYTSMIYTHLINLLNDTSTYELPKDYFNTDTSHCYKNSQVEFGSKFESGNLRMALKVNEGEYDLIIRPEIGSSRTYHWFFFSVKLKTNTTNPSKSIVKFNIINMTKQQILLNDDVRILSYYDGSWSRDTFDLFYYQNGLLSTSEAVFSTLTYSFDFNSINTTTNTNDKIVYFAYCFPYTYTRLSLYLNSLINHDNILRFEVIGKSLQGNELQMLVITDFTDDDYSLSLKHSILLTGRVHPGESNSSFTVEGVIEFLLSTNPIAVQLRSLFIFKIIPMLNPDGVLYGNFRMNMQGKDLNRMWTEPTNESSPSIVAAKNIIVKTLNSRNIYLYCDFHGHSRKSNFFLYSCKSTSLVANPLKAFRGNNIDKKKPKILNEYHELVFPYLFHKENSILDITSCTNKIHPTKMKTARAVLKMEYNVDLSYCLESSMASIRLQNGELIPFTMSLYKQIGKDFCLSLINLVNKKTFALTLNDIRAEKKNEQQQNIKKDKEKDKKRRLLPPIMFGQSQFGTITFNNKKKSNSSCCSSNSTSCISSIQAIITNDPYTISNSKIREYYNPISSKQLNYIQQHKQIESSIQIKNVKKVNNNYKLNNIISNKTNDYY